MSSGLVRKRVSDRLAQQLQWLIAIRLIVITSILLPTFLLSVTEAGEAQLPVGFVLRLAGMFYLAALLYLMLLKLWRRHYQAQAHLQFLGDLLLISYLVHHTGGLSSMFSMLYLIVVAIASVLLRLRAGLTIAGVAWLLYAGLVIAHYQGWLVAGSPLGEMPTRARLAYGLTAHLLGFYGVAFLTSYLARDASNVEKELAETIESLAELEVLHRDVIESITSGLITTDPEGKVVSVNTSGRLILQAEPGALLERPIFETGLLTAEHWNELQSQPARPSRVRDEVELVRAGERQWIGFSLAELKDHAGKRRGYTVIFQDLTEQHRLRERLRINDRMAAVGELAAGLAHEIGNPLAAISGSAQLLAQTASEGGSRKLLDIVKLESDRLDRTIKDFLRFARPRPRQSTVFDIGRQLEHNVELLRNSQELGSHHRLELKLSPDSAQIEADPDQVSQIFWNLARNALRAMPNGGTLEITGSLEGDHYRLRFVDSGKGMTAEEVANLFHPYKSFFDGGSGIGMAIVYRIVDEHRGEINVESAPDRGTSIDVVLPASSGVAPTSSGVAPTSSGVAPTSSGVAPTSSGVGDRTTRSYLEAQ